MVTPRKVSLNSERTDFVDLLTLVLQDSSFLSHYSFLGRLVVTLLAPSVTCSFSPCSHRGWDPASQWKGLHPPTALNSAYNPLEVDCFLHYFFLFLWRLRIRYAGERLEIIRICLCVICFGLLSCVRVITTLLSDRRGISTRSTMI
jgi:hypothetical protein